MHRCFSCGRFDVSCPAPFPEDQYCAQYSSAGDAGLSHFETHHEFAERLRTVARHGWGLSGELRDMLATAAERIDGLHGKVRHLDSMLSGKPSKL